MTPPSTAVEAEVRLILRQWAEATRTGRRNDVLANHLEDALIYGVLPPMKYEGKEAYRRSWDDWQPETQDEAQFKLQDHAVTAGADLAFAHSFIACGGVLANGTSFEDLVRATFYLRKTSGSWEVSHHHISKPVGPAPA